MTPENFCYWLQGYMELSNVAGKYYISEKQLKCIEERLNSVKHTSSLSMKGQQFNVASPFNGHMWPVGT
jgi:hypothetical protein